MSRSGSLLTRVSGSQTAPIASTVIADSGALAAGTYRVVAQIGVSDTVAVGKGAYLQVRDAANAATLHQALVPAAVSQQVELGQVTLALNERIRVVSSAVAGAASSVYTALIEVYRL